MRENSAFPIGTDGLPVYPTRAEAIEMVERVTRERDEAVALLRSLYDHIQQDRLGLTSELTTADVLDQVEAFSTRLITRYADQIEHCDDCDAPASGRCIDRHHTRMIARLDASGGGE